MSLKIEDIQVGDELVCIDEDYYLKHLRFRLVKESKVSFVYDHSFKINDCLFLSCDLKYFKKKEQSQYTFDDLIDVARKAFKDAKIFSFGVTDCAVGIRLLDKSEKIFTLMDICSGVVFIQSLYKETFTIECEEDLKKIKDCQVVLSNGNSFSMKNIAFHDNKTRNCLTVHFDSEYETRDAYGFLELKGATVEQERGRSE